MATTAPYVVAALSAEHYTPDTAEAIKVAATVAGRNHAVIGATPHPGRPTLKQLAASSPVTMTRTAGRLSSSRMPRPPTPKLAAVATAVVSHHGRLLLIDSGEPGAARRLLDSLALPWSENT